MRYHILGASLVIILIYGCEKIDALRYGEKRSVIVYSTESFASSPDAVQLKSGELMVVFNERSDSTALDGNILRTTSTDCGKTWSLPDTIVDTAWDCRDPSVTQLRDGLILVNFTQSNYDAQDEDRFPMGCFTVRSFDNGKSFTAPRKVSLEIFDWISTSAPVVELENGTLLLPAYGGRDGGPGSAFVVVSKDGGESWNDVFMITEDEAYFKNPCLIQLADKRLICLLEISGEGYGIYQSISEDQGMTWSRPERMGIGGREPDILISQDGTLLCVFQDYWPRGISCVRSYDYGRTWEQKKVLASTDVLNVSPCLTHLKDGRLFVCYGYDDMKQMDSDASRTIKGILFNLPKPETPGGFNASFEGDEGVRLRWNPVKGAFYYVVYRDSAAHFVPRSGYPFQGNGIASPTESWFTDVHVDTGKTYFYRITAVVGRGELKSGTGSESDPSESVEVITR